jgi:hypothetical protein
MSVPFVVLMERQLQALPAWLAGLGCNSCSHDGGRKINVGRTSGRKYSYVASIMVKDRALFERTLEVVKETVFSRSSTNICSPLGDDRGAGE